MEISVRRTGGFAGVDDRLGPVETNEIYGGIGDQLERVVRDVDFFELPWAFPSGPGEDLFEFTATVTDAGRSHSTSWDDLSDRPPELDRLIELLLEAGQTWVSNRGTGSGANPLFQVWVHSREEDTDDIEVYRPQGFDFPPAFGRDGFEIRPDGSFVRRDIGPADGTVEVPGRWTAQVVRATFDDPSVEPSTLELVSYDEERLELRRRPADDDPGSPGLPCGDWSAYLDLMPPGPSVLRVRGMCTFPSTGYTATLERHQPPGFNPRDLLLDLTVTEPDGPVAQVVTEVEVRFEEEAAQGEYDTVTILPDGPSLPVEEVH
jgi:hypothetical protein